MLVKVIFITGPSFLLFVFSSNLVPHGIPKDVGVLLHVTVNVIKLLSSFEKSYQYGGNRLLSFLTNNV